MGAVIAVLSELFFKQVTEPRLKEVTIVFLTGFSKSSGEHILASHKLAKSSCPLATHGVAVKSYLASLFFLSTKKRAFYSSFYC